MWTTQWICKWLSFDDWGMGFHLRLEGWNIGLELQNWWDSGNSGKHRGTDSSLKCTNFDNRHWWYHQKFIWPTPLLFV
jgi:hypothetical protein